MASLMLVQCVIASHVEVWACQFWCKFYQELTVTMVQVPERTAVSTQSQHYIQKKGHADQRRSFKLSSGWLCFVNWTISSCLTSQASKLYQLAAFDGAVKDNFFKLTRVNEVCNSLLANVISLNKILSYARLSRNTERQKVQIIIFETRTKRIGEA